MIDAGGALQQHTETPDTRNLPPEQQSSPSMHTIATSATTNAPINVSSDYPPHGEGWGFGGD